MPSRTYTIETRISNKSELAEYLNQYVTEYSAVTREMWHDMTSPDFVKRYPKMSGYLSHICKKHGLLKRTVNSIQSDIHGRMKSLMELKKTELKQVATKISVKEGRIADIKAKLDVLKPKAIANTLTEKELQRYCNLKSSLYWQKNKLNKLKQCKDKLEY